MKPGFALILALALSSSAFARIGETEAQLSKRYGSPITTGTLPLGRTLYKFKGFTITVHFSAEGKSDMEEIRQGDLLTMPESVVEGLLRANAPARTYWRYYHGQNSWKRSDGKARAYVMTGKFTVQAITKGPLEKSERMIDKIEAAETKGF